MVDYIKIGERVKFPDVWGRLLREWCSVMDEYSNRAVSMNEFTKSQGGDLAYWHKKEGSNVGFLAAAVWRVGGVVLQEFQVTRGQRKGHADLWIQLDELNCHMEAKGNNQSTTSRESVDQALALAKDQLNIPDDERADIGLALCFVAPGVPTPGRFFDFRGLARQFETEDSIVAVYLTDRENIGYEGYNYPGVALIGQLVWQLPLTSETEKSEAMK